MKAQLIKFLKDDIIICSILILLTIAAEVFAACGYIRVAFFIYLFIFISLILSAVYKNRENVYPLYMSLTFFPLIRIINIALPLTGIPGAYGFLAVSVPLFIAGIIIAQNVHLTSSEMGFCFSKTHQQLLIALLGLPLGFIGFIIIKPDIKETAATPGGVILWVLVFIICTGFLEEFLFRGILYNVILNLKDDKKALFYTSFLYTVLMISGKSFLNVIYAFSVSIIFCRIFGQFKSILGLSLAHGLTNIMLYIICPYIFNKISF
ncbi:MAG: CPBP family intramembrane glutamic endopeptidase [Eubacteriales bacterium]